MAVIFNNLLRMVYSLSGRQSEPEKTYLRDFIHSRLSEWQIWQTNPPANQGDESIFKPK